MTLEELIKEQRIYLCISQQELADKAELSIATVKAMEKGTANPALSTLMRVLDVLGLDIAFTLKRPRD